MSVFDLFGKDSRLKSERGLRVETGSVKKPPYSVISPTGYDDVSLIIDELKAGKTIVVHLTELKTETALRVLDMLSGAIYALDGGVYEMQKNIYMFSPSGVELK